jgi:A/G-specific adenine glycosylase
MLQQTRVEVVAEYWRRFLEAFPTIAALAAAEEDRVLALWSGLGYYRRARALLAAARAVVADHGGELPADPVTLAALPGFGPYTTGAVASIAFGLPVALVDGNVARVLTRLFAIEGVPATGAAKRAVWARAEELLERKNPGTWNQALMELGALICKPKSPLCETCPVSGSCQAVAQGRTSELPHRVAPKPTRDVAVEALVLGFPGGWLLARRPPGGRNSGLIELPTREASRPATGRWPATWATPELAVLFAEATPLASLRHSITHHRITVEARRLDCKPALATRIAAASAYDLVPRTRAGDLALSGLTAKLLTAT